jgi:cobalamin biosynthesis Mg chelatase CobN
MHCRIRNVLLLLAITAVSASKSHELKQLSLKRQARSLEETPTQSPIIPHKEDKPKPAPKPANHPPPATKVETKKPPAPKPSPKHAPAPAPTTSESSSSSSSGSSSSSSGSSSSTNGNKGAHSVGHHSGPSPNIKDKSSTHGDAKTPLLLLIGAAASTLIVAGYTKARRRAKVVKEHPLKGSIGRRMKLFGELAGKKKGGTLGGSLEDEEMSYKSADDYGIAIV